MTSLQNSCSAVIYALRVEGVRGGVAMKLFSKNCLQNCEMFHTPQQLNLAEGSIDLIQQASDMPLILN